MIESGSTVETLKLLKENQKRKPAEERFTDEQLEAYVQFRCMQRDDNVTRPVEHFGLSREMFEELMDECHQFSINRLIRDYNKEDVERLRINMLDTTYQNMMKESTGDQTVSMLVLLEMLKEKQKGKKNVKLCIPDELIDGLSEAVAGMWEESGFEKFLQESYFKFGDGKLAKLDTEIRGLRDAPSFRIRVAEALKKKKMATLKVETPRNTIPDEELKNADMGLTTFYEPTAKSGKMRGSEEDVVEDDVKIFEVTSPEFFGKVVPKEALTNAEWGSNFNKKTEMVKIQIAEEDDEVVPRVVNRCVPRISRKDVKKLKVLAWNIEKPIIEKPSQTRAWSLLDRSFFVVSICFLTAFSAIIFQDFFKSLF